MVDSPVCPLCREEVQDDLHMIWRCPCIIASEHPAIVKSGHLLQKAVWNMPIEPCTWARGLVPRGKTHRDPVGKLVVKAIRDRDIKTLFFLIGDVFLDGSGGIYSKNPRLRSCGCAWVQPFADSRLEADKNYGVGVYASVPGKQAVPRAEAYALLIFLILILKSCQRFFMMLL